MEKIIVKAYAKVNLVLDVLRKREDGYHELRMIMQTVDYCDILEIEKKEEPGIDMTCDVPGLATDESNLVCKAAKKMMDAFPITGGVKIYLSKKIPMAAGMAGGSADAAAVLNGMNELFALNASKESLCELGVTIGADVPFCVMGGTVLCEGIGEVMTKLLPMPSCHMLVIKPDFDVSTGFVYGNLAANSLPYHPDVDGMVSAIEEGDLVKMSGCMGNVLETVTERAYPVIGEIKAFMRGQGALNALMSGSGPSIFGIFTNKEAAESCGELLKTKYPEAQIFVTTPV